MHWQVFNPMNIEALQHDVEDSLVPLRKWYISEKIEALKKELPLYVAKANTERVSSPESTRLFWAKWQS